MSFKESNCFLLWLFCLLLVVLVISWLLLLDKFTVSRRRWHSRISLTIENFKLSSRNLKGSNDFCILFNIRSRFLEISSLKGVFWFPAWCCWWAEWCKSERLAFLVLWTGDSFPEFEVLSVDTFAADRDGGNVVGRFAGAMGVKRSYWLLGTKQTSLKQDLDSWVLWIYLPGQVMVGFIVIVMITDSLALVLSPVESLSINLGHFAIGRL